MAAQVEMFDVLPDKLEYWPGETMTGKVVLKVKNGSLQTQGIFLNVKGGATVGIVDQQVYYTRRTSFGNSSNSNFRHTNTHVNTQSYQNSENYLSLGSYLVGNGQSGLSLQEGETVYPFSILLPSRLVSSYMGDSGPLIPNVSNHKGNAKVVYYFELGLKMPGREDLVVKKIISLHGIVDLSAFPESSQAGEAEQSKVFSNYCCCFFDPQQGPVTLKVKTPRRGYLPGETILFEVELNNPSGIEIRDLSVELTEVAILKSQGKVEDMIHCVPGRVYKSQVEPTSSLEGFWKGELVVPPEGVVYPSKLGGGCSMIDLDYFLKATAYVDGCCDSNFGVSSNIIIGTCRSATTQVRSSNTSSSSHVTRHHKTKKKSAN